MATGYEETINLQSTATATSPETTQPAAHDSNAAAHPRPVAVQRTFRSSLYGFAEADLDERRHFLEASLQIEFEARESLYRGGAYYRHQVPGEAELVLQCNYDALDDEPAEESHPEMKIILYVDGDPDRVGRFEAAIDARVPEASLLRRLGD